MQGTVFTLVLLELFLLSKTWYHIQCQRVDELSSLV